MKKLDEKFKQAAKEGIKALAGALRETFEGPTRQYSSEEIILIINSFEKSFFEIIEK